MIQGRSGAHLALALSLYATAALAQPPQASPVGEEKAAGAARKLDPGAKPESKPEKGGPKGENLGKPEVNPAKGGEKTAEPTVSVVDRKEPDETRTRERLERKKRQQEAARAKVTAALRGQPMSEAMTQELSRHARRLARLERIKAVALDAKDTAVVERVNKLIDKENARHDKFAAHAESKDDKTKDDKAKDDKAGAK
jgi:hypothetical protein